MFLYQIISDLQVGLLDIFLWNKRGEQELYIIRSVIRIAQHSGFAFSKRRKGVLSGSVNLHLPETSVSI